jgi:tetratricopeptide (TPR) repeat protein
MIRLFVWWLFVFCFLAPFGALAQKPATIAGNVYYESDYHAAKNITVSLFDGDRVFLESQSTSDDGLFRFGGLRRAMYTLTIDVSGYEPVSLDVDISMASDKSLAIYLKPIAHKQDVPQSKTVSVHELSLPVKARELMDSGMKKLYQDKDAQNAVVDFQQAVSAAPTYYEADYQLAMAQLTVGNQGEAESSFRKAIELSGDKYADAEVGLGAVLLDRGDTIEAVKAIRRGLQLNPKLWLGHYELGRALLKQDHLFEAQASAEQARLLAPSAPIVYRLLSNIHLLQKDYPALLEDLNTYLELDPTSPVGIRAKQLRDQVQLKVSAQHLAHASTNP